MFGASLVGIGERMRECVSVLEVEEVQFYCQFCTSNEAGLGEPMSRASAQKKKEKSPTTWLVLLYKCITEKVKQNFRLKCLPHNVPPRQQILTCPTSQTSINDCVI